VSVLNKFADGINHLSTTMTDIDCLQQQIDKITENQNTQNGSRNLEMNICIVNNPHRDDENLSHLVSYLFIEGLRMRDIEFTTTVRKNGSDGKPGVIIVNMKTVEDKE
jgi:hypothetical protein